MLKWHTSNIIIYKNSKIIIKLKAREKLQVTQKLFEGVWFHNIQGRQKNFFMNFILKVIKGNQTSEMRRKNCLFNEQLGERQEALAK